jgi:hypothetical protein
MKKSTRRIDALSEFFGQVHSLTYGVIYLILIPTFAFVYFLLPGHFYHSTIQYEASIEYDKSRITDIILSTYP